MAAQKYRISLFPISPPLVHHHWQYWGARPLWRLYMFKFSLISEISGSLYFPR
jgi:hypothetical protein